ncbi:MAG TPA: hypothetical protein VFZ49_10025 [Pyrinomonadaceae bacterium]
MRFRHTSIKALVIGLFVSAGFGVFFTRTDSSKAANDDILTELANYKSWGRITKAPYQVLALTTTESLAPKAEMPSFDLSPGGG